MSKSYKRIAAVAKSNEILKFLADQKGPSSGADIAKAINLPYPTVLCHLATLEDSQFVKKTGENYEPGPMFALMWSRYRARLQSQIGRFTQEFNDLEA